MDYKRESKLGAFFRGFSSIFNLFPTTKPTFILDDEEAIRSDWQAVGDDLCVAINDLREGIKVPHEKVQGVGGKKLSPEEFASRATEILDEALSKLPPEEQERRLKAFEQAVARRREVR